MVQRERTLTKDQVAERLAAHAEELRSLGVRSLDLFGSVARGDARPESDVDLLVEFDEVPGFAHKLLAGLARRLREADAKSIQ